MSSYFPPCVAMCPPAVRMICVVVYKDEDSTGEGLRVENYDVLAIRDTLVCDRENPLDDGTRQTDALVVDDGCIIPARELRELYSAYAVETLLVACPWPPDEDESMLASWVDVVKGRLVRRNAASVRPRSRHPRPNLPNPDPIPASGAWTPSRPRSRTMHRMPFGKYRGRDLHEVPDDYLAWLLDNVGPRALVDVRRPPRGELPPRRATPRLPPSGDPARPAPGPRRPARRRLEVAPPVVLAVPPRPRRVERRDACCQRGERHDARGCSTRRACFDAAAPAVRHSRHRAAAHAAVADRRPRRLRRLGPRRRRPLACRPQRPDVRGGVGPDFAAAPRPACRKVCLARGRPAGREEAALSPI